MTGLTWPIVYFNKIEPSKSSGIETGGTRLGRAECVETDLRFPSSGEVSASSRLLCSIRILVHLVLLEHSAALTA